MVMVNKVFGNLLGGALGSIRNPVRGARPAAQEFRLRMIIGGTGVTFRVASYVAGDFNLATHYTVQAQEEATWGWGIADESENQGYIFLRYQTVVPAAIDGPIRFQIEDAHGAMVPGGLALQEDSTLLDGSQTDRRLMLPLPKYAMWATEDSRLAIRIDPTATATSTSADSTVQVPITLRRAAR